MATTDHELHRDREFADLVFYDPFIPEGRTGLAVVPIPTLLRREFCPCFGQIQFGNLT